MSIEHASPAPATGSSSWSREQVESLLRAEEFGYQKIALPYGLSTSGEDRGSTCRQILPDDLTGKTVLDIGSLHGYFCFEAMNRGAKAALGIEVNPDSVRKAQRLADCLGSKAQFRVADIERDTVEGPFDYVLCLNVLHHLRNPLAALEKLIGLTRERLALEVASMGRRDRRKLKLSWLAAFFLRRAPVLFVQQKGRGQSGQGFFITPRAMHTLLFSHRRVFASVQLLDSAHKNRFLALANRRRIDRMLVVSGPTASGKSTFINRLCAGDYPEVVEALGLGDISRWKQTTAGELLQNEQAHLDQVIFHYDFLHPYFRSSKTYERDELLDVLDCASELIFLTLWTPPERLRAQLDECEIQPRTINGRFRGNKRHLEIRQQYDSPDKILQYYRNWLAFTRTKPGPRWMVTTTPAVRVFRPEEWEAV